MSIAEALAWASERLAFSPTSEGDARLLLEHVLGVERSYLIAHSEQTLSNRQEETFRELVGRAEKQEPIPYITGKAPFFGLDFTVTPAVLIPRPETELLVERAMKWAEKSQVRHAVDVGTGSGGIAVTLARHLDNTRVSATDVSEEALAIARKNAKRHNVIERITFYHGSLLEPVDGPIDLVVANLPYVSDAEWTTLDDGVKWYEPAGALRGGHDGLELIQALLRRAQTQLQVGGALFLEIGWRQGAAALDLAQSIFPAAQITIEPDYAGHDRMVIVETQ